MDRCVLLSTDMWRFRSCPAAVLTWHSMTSESQSSWLDGDKLSRVQKTHILSYINSESEIECACFFPSMSAEKINCIWMNGHGGGVWWSGTGAERDLHMHTHIHTCMLACCMVCALPQLNSGAGLTQPDSMLAYARTYFCERLAIHPLPSSSCFSLVMLPHISRTEAALTKQLPSFTYQSILPHLTSLIVTLPGLWRFITRGGGSMSGHSAEGGGSKGWGEGRAEETVPLP